MTTPAILLIEDSPMDALLIGGALAEVVPPDQIGTLARGDEALDFFACRGAYAQRNPAEVPTVVLLDLNLPDMAGIEVLKSIRNNPATRLLPVTVLSGSEDPGDIRLAAECGANSFVRKEVNLADMARHLQQIARYWLDLNVPPPMRSRQ